MPVPTLVTDLSTTALSNSPAGSDNVFPDLDNYLRALSAFVASIRDNSGNGWVSPYLALAGGTVTGSLAINGNTTLGDAVGDTITVNGAATFVNANPTLSAGTANGVLYLNGSKVATSGTGLVFDGTSLGVGTNTIPANVKTVIASPNTAVNSRGNLYVYTTDAATADYGAQLALGGSFSGTSEAPFAAIAGRFVGGTTGYMQFSILNSGTVAEQMRLTTTGLGIGTSSPVGKLSVVGNILAPSFNTNTTYTIGIQDAQTNTFVATKRGNLQIQASSGVTGADGMGGGDLTLKAGNSYIGASGVDGNVNIVSGYNLAGASLSSGSITFTTNNTQRAVIDPSGNLGLGVTPSAWGASFRSLDVGAYASFWNTSGGTIGMAYNAYHNGTNFIYRASSIAPANYQQSLGQHQWFTAASGTAGNAITFTQAMTLDASGNLLVGTTTTANNLRLNESLAIVKAVSGYPGMGLTGYVGTGAGYRPIIDFNRSRGTTDGSMTVVGNGDSLGSIIFRGSDGTSFQDAAYILAEVDGVPGASDMPGRICFYTTPDGSATSQERARITSGGDLVVGDTTALSRLTYKGTFNATSAGSKPSLTGSGSYGGGIGFVDTNVAGIYTDSSGATLKFFTSQGGSDTAESKVKMMVNSSGNLLVASDTSYYSSGKLQILGGKTLIRSTDAGYGQFQIGNNASAGEVSIAFISGVTAFGGTPTSTNGNNYIWVAGASIYGIGGDSWGIGNVGAGGYVAKIAYNSTSWTFSSDERLKNVEGQVENALTKIAGIRPVYYTWKNDDSNKRKVGLIAQDVLAVLPEAVDVPETEAKPDGSPTYLGLAHNDVLPLLVAAIQELKAEVDSLKAQLKGA